MLFKRKPQEEKPITVIKELSPRERRDESRDRRSFGPASTFPLIDSDNQQILLDRRSRPDRRLNNIVVKETNISLNSENISL